MSGGETFARLLEARAKAEGEARSHFIGALALLAEEIERTPEIAGISEAKMARATISSLKAHKSSIEPPPRATISTSTSFLALKNFSALTISSAEPSPWTRTG